MADQTKYSKLTDTTVAVSGYKGDVPKHLVIPAQIKHSGSTYNVTEIGMKAFSGCTQLQNISMNGVEIVREKAFAGCEKLTTLLLSDTLKEIDSYGFAWCGVEAIKLPAAMQQIGEYAFVGCNHLRGVICEANVPPTLYGNSFDPETLTKGILYVHTNQIETYKKAENWNQFANIVSIEEEANKRARLVGMNEDDEDEDNEEEDEKDLIYTDDIIYRIESEDKVSVEQCNPDVDSRLDIPETVSKDGKIYRVISLNKESVNGCTKLKQLGIPASIEFIDFGAFVYCHALTDILVAPSNQFYTDVDGVLTDKYKSILVCYPKGRKATSYQVPASIMSIAPACFLDCQALESVYLFDNVQHIGIQSFFNCKNLRSISLPTGTDEINGGAFYNCEKLSSIYVLRGLPAGINDSFDAKTLKEATLYVKREDLQDYKKDEEWGKFAKIRPLNAIERTDIGCTFVINGEQNATLVETTAGLKGTLTLPETIESAGKTYTIDRIGRNSVEGQEEITKVELPNSIKSIGYQAFNICRKLQEINLPDSLCIVENQVFNECTALKKLRIPKNMEAIGERLVEDATALDFIEVDEDNRQYCSKDGVLYDRRGAIVAYPSGKKESSFEIGTNVDSISFGVFGNAKFLTTFSVAANNKHYATIDGVLTNHEQNKLVVYPCGRNDKSYDVYGSIKEIGQLAFRNSKLNQINLPESLEKLEKGAFFECDQLKKITIPNGITEISDRCFLSCSSLKHVDLPDSIEKIRMGAFGACRELDSISIPPKVNCIENGTFANCFAMTSVELPNGIESIGDYAFVNCPQLTSINLPASLNTIGGNAFKGCFTELANLNYMLAKNKELEIEIDATIPPVILDNSFDEYTYSKIALVVPNDSVEAYRKTEGWSNFKTIKGKDEKKGKTSALTFTKDDFVYNIIKEDQVEIAKYKGEQVDLTLHETVEHNGKSYRIGRIGESAFEENNYLFEIDIEAPIESIGKFAFANSRLKKIHLPHTLKEIGTGAFGGSELTSIHIPYGVREIGLEAFAECHDLESAMLPNGIERINFHTFFNCHELKYAYVPDSVESIEEGAFANCNSLKEVYLGNNLTEISNSAFEACSLREVYAPKDLVYIGDKAFYKCEGLRHIYLPKTIDYIGTDVFRKCLSLTAIDVEKGGEKYSSIDGILYNQDQTELLKVPVCKTADSSEEDHLPTYLRKKPMVVTLAKTVKKIADSALEDCELRHIALPEGLTSIGERSFNNSSIEEIDLPAKLRSIGPAAFMGCKKLKSVVIPAKVTTLKAETFRACIKLEDVKLEGKMKLIETQAFKGCNILTSIAIDGENCEIKEQAFDSCKILEEVRLSGMKRVDEDAFSNCPKKK